ncbi:MAG: DUF4082 domain-containing protein [Bacteroidota bacterium]|nr:DUF4082 domain-containing protein [Bacteroidota bacterium]
MIVFSTLVLILVLTHSALAGPGFMDCWRRILATAAGFMLMTVLQAQNPPTTIFTNQTPGSVTSNDGKALELGVKFSSSTPGYITGVRFYKTSGNMGTHIGELYSSSGIPLAQATFTNESGTGWQTASFSTPVAIKANTTYIAAYFSSDGNYTYTYDYFSNPVFNSPLTALAAGTDGPNGVYCYSSGPAFPSSANGNKLNYWVDVLFSDQLSSAFANAGSNQTISLPTSSVALDGSGSIGPITDYTWTEISGPNAAAIAQPATISTMVTGMIQGTYVFQLAVNGTSSVSQVTVTVLAEGSVTSVFANPAPVSVTTNDGMSVELGVKFRSSVSGYVTGVRFYKTSGNTGTHFGELYSSAGTRLAQAVFTNETGTGWQTVFFGTPVAIAANTTYVAAYFSLAGNYTYTAGYFTDPVVNGPLTALADGTDGPNGVYEYTSSPAFPSSASGNKINYWVDPVFMTNTKTQSGSGNDTLAYFLLQNFPNPVPNQNTRISYKIPVNAAVELVLFDLQGRQVKMLVNEKQDAGIHYYDLNTATLGKGLYFYRLRSGNFWDVRKMIVD